MTSLSKGIVAPDTCSSQYLLPKYLLQKHPLRSSRSSRTVGVVTKRDEVLDALDDLIDAIELNSANNKAILSRAKVIKRERGRGRPYSEIASAEKRPLIVEMITDNLNRLTNAGTTFRRAEARALHREGVTMERIAELFGVTRQRVSALLANGKRDRSR